MNRDFDSAVKKARSALDAAIIDRKASAGPCSSCRHMAVRWVRIQGDEPCCTHPVVAPPRFDPVDHELEQDAVMAKLVRRPGGLCGAEGKLYEKAEPAKTLFNTILRWLP